MAKMTRSPDSGNIAYHVNELLNKYGCSISYDNHGDIQYGVIYINHHIDDNGDLWDVDEDDDEDDEDLDEEGHEGALEDPNIWA